MAALRPGELWLEERGVDARRTLVLAGDLDAATAPVLRERIARLCSPHISELTLDLGDVTLIEAHGTEALLAARAARATAASSRRQASAGAPAPPQGSRVVASG